MTAIFTLAMAQTDREYVGVGWSTQYFGPDGPWQAISLKVDDTDMSLIPTVDSTQQVHSSLVLRFVLHQTPLRCLAGMEAASHPARPLFPMLDII